MIRKTLLTISVVLLIATVALWSHSYVVSDAVGWEDRRGTWSVEVDRGILVATAVRPLVHVIARRPTDSTLVHTIGPRGWFRTQEIRTNQRWTAFDWGRSPSCSCGGVTSYLTLPLWLLGLMFAICPVTLLVSPLRAHNRRRHNRCVPCGYNLTGNVSGVCPECGTTIERHDLILQS